MMAKSNLKRRRIFIAAKCVLATRYRKVLKSASSTCTPRTTSHILELAKMPILIKTNGTADGSEKISLSRFSTFRHKQAAYYLSAKKSSPRAPLHLGFCSDFKFSGWKKSINTHDPRFLKVMNIVDFKISC